MYLRDAVVDRNIDAVRPGKLIVFINQSYVNIDHYFISIVVQTNERKMSKVSEAFEGVKRDEKKRKYRAQGKEENRLKRAREGGGGGRGWKKKGGGDNED